MKKYFVIYQYVGKDEEDDYHTHSYDWVAYRCVDERHALERFWNYEEGGYYFNHREHKKDFKILEVKSFDSEEEEEKFKSDYWRNQSLFVRL